MTITENALSSIGELACEVKKLTALGQRWLFRGQADARWALSPSVHRGYTPQQERYLTNEFRARTQPLFLLPDQQRLRKYSLFPDLSALTSELRTIHLPRNA